MDYFSYGGTEVQSKRQKYIFEQNGHKVYFLTFDKNFPINSDIYNT